MTDAQERILLDNNTKINQMIGTLTGSNDGGLVREIRETKDGLDELRKTSVTRDSCSRNHDGPVNRRQKTFGIVRDIFLVTIGLAVVYQALWSAVR